MCKYTSYTVKYTLYTGIEKQRLFLMKNFFHKYTDKCA